MPEANLLAARRLAGTAGAVPLASAVLGLAVLVLAVCAGVGGAEKPATTAPGDPFSLPTSRMLDAAACRRTALAAEKAQAWPEALSAWERVIDRCAAGEPERVEARSHIKLLHPKVPPNADPQKARSWKVLVLVFRHLDFSWTSGRKTIEVHKTISAQDEQKIRTTVASFGEHVARHSSGMLRIDAEIVVVDEPLTRLGREGRDGYFPAYGPIRATTDPLIKAKAYDTVFAYAKFSGDKGPDVPQPYIAATYASVRELGGAGFITVPWHARYPLPGEADGEMELHEWLHQIDWMFCHVLHYPDELVPTSDAGRFEGDNRPGGDPEYARKPSESSWMRFYQHIMEEHVTRQMWSEAATRLAPGQPPPGDLIKPGK